jgi:hypothetical protein
MRFESWPGDCQQPAIRRCIAELGQCHLRWTTSWLEGIPAGLKHQPNHYGANFGLLTLYTRTGPRECSIEAV